MSGKSEPSDETAPLGERGPDDELALRVAEARVAAKLFGTEQDVSLGRYRLFEVVGRGGMGVVWSAWDPELERRVAIKLVDPRRASARDKIVDEARALAKLSHPNVVPIYDVGVVEDRVYLVMEWVEGENLRAHLHGRHSVKDIVEVYAQAARGLAAVHAAGLVHRDFKPENAMVGRDGRVRVLDFGLARGSEGKAGEVAGTPRYMAPEQRAGEAPTAAVDQYALCIALRDALVARDGEGRTAVVPRWLDRIVTRGTAERAEERFPSIDDVLRALGRDPGRVWRLRIGAGALVAAVGLGFVVARTQAPAAEAPCSGEPDGAAWSSDARTRVEQHLATLGDFASNARPALLATLDAHHQAWRTEHRTACIAHSRQELTPSLYERRLTCLARAAASLGTTADLLARATVASFPTDRIAASALVSPALCARVDQSLVAPPAPATEPAVRAASIELERARMLATAQRPEAVAVAAAARAQADATAYAPLRARGLLVEGRAQMALDDPRAATTLAQAMDASLAARDDVTAVEAFARHAYVVTMHDGPVVDGASVIQPIAARLGDEGAFARLLLLNNLAVTRMAANDNAGARALLETAMRGWRPGSDDEDAYELASIPQNYALVVDDPATSLDLLARARTEVARLLGADHPKVLEIVETEVLFTTDLAKARALADDACARRAKLFPHLTSERTSCAYEAGWLADEANDQAAAAAHFALAAFAPADEPARAEVVAVLRENGDAAVQARRLEAAADLAAKAEAPWLRTGGADAYIAAARAWERAGDRAAAHRCWSAALPILTAVERPYTARRLARVRAAVNDFRQQNHPTPL